MPLVRAYSQPRPLELDVIGIHTGLGIAGDARGALSGSSPSWATGERRRRADLAPAGRTTSGRSGARPREVSTIESCRARAQGRRRPARVFELMSDQERRTRARIGAERRVFSARSAATELGPLRDAAPHDRPGGIVAWWRSRSRQIAAPARGATSRKRRASRGAKALGRDLAPSLLHMIIDLPVADRTRRRRRRAGSASSTS
jgi:hypothetical protein